MSRDGLCAKGPRLSSRSWARWLVVLALLASVGLYAIESNHHHHTERGRLLCPVCHVVAHSSTTIYDPPHDGFRPFYNLWVHSRLQKSHPVRVHTLLRGPRPRAPPRSAVI